MNRNTNFINKCKCAVQRMFTPFAVKVYIYKKNTELVYSKTFE